MHSAFAKPTADRFGARGAPNMVAALWSGGGVREGGVDKDTRRLLREKANFPGRIG